MRRLASVGVGPGWTCLEVGAGRGSIAHWLAEAVSPRGRVVATDIDISHMDHLNGRYVEVREHDVLSDGLERDTYDLVHCRLVLLHLSDPVRAIERMYEAVRPGGWLVLEEPVFAEPCIVSRDHVAAGSVERVWRTFREVVSADMDLDFGITAMRLVAGLGMDDFSVEQTRAISPGGKPGPITYMLSMEFFRDQLLGSGTLAPDDLDVFNAAMLDPSFIGSGPYLFGVFGRKR
jgi:SAM-dependent methyltransferase